MTGKTKNGNRIIFFAPHPPFAASKEEWDTTTDHEMQLIYARPKNEQKTKMSLEYAEYKLQGHEILIGKIKVEEGKKIFLCKSLGTGPDTCAACAVQARGKNAKLVKLDSVNAARTAESLKEEIEGAGAMWERNSALDATPEKEEVAFYVHKRELEESISPQSGEWISDRIHSTRGPRDKYIATLSPHWHYGGNSADELQFASFFNDATLHIRICKEYEIIKKGVFGAEIAPECKDIIESVRMARADEQ